MGRLTMRRRLYEEQHGKCHYCDIHMHLGVEKIKNAACTIDHVRPRSEGGGNHRANLVGACFTCNNIRGTRSYTAFRWFVKKYGRGYEPDTVFAELDRKSPDYLDNLSIWGELVGVKARMVVRYGNGAFTEPITAPPPPIKLKMGGRRPELDKTRKDIEDIVEKIGLFDRNKIWTTYLKAEKENGRPDQIAG